LKQLVGQLDQTKADKTTVNNELDKVENFLNIFVFFYIFLFQKVDKRDIDNRVLKKDFNAACNELSQNINDCMQKFNVHVCY